MTAAMQRLNRLINDRLIDRIDRSLQQQLANMTAEVQLVDATIDSPVTSHRQYDILAQSHAMQQLVNEVQMLLEICSHEPLPQPPQPQKICQIPKLCHHPRM